MLTLAELDARFVRHSVRVDTWQQVSGDPDTWRARGCPTVTVTGTREFVTRVDTLAQAHSVEFLCPGCFVKNNGPVGTHLVRVTLHDRAVPPELGSRNTKGEPSRWTAVGDGLDNLSLHPSVDCGCWHGHVQNGAAV